MTRNKFCAAEGISLLTYKLLHLNKLAPEERIIPGTLSVVDITPEAYARWRKMVQQPNSKAAEIIRRGKIARRRGLLATKSPNHPVNLIKKLRARESA